MHLDNKRLQSIQRFKHIVQRKIDTETDPNELHQWETILQHYREEEQKILKRSDIQ